MQVAVFPLVGIACLLVMIPPKKLVLPVFSQSSKKSSKIERKRAKERKAYLDSIPTGVTRRSQRLFAIAVIVVLFLEPAIMSYDSSDDPYWNIKFATQLHWIMFADGGSESRERFRIRERVYDPTTGRIRLDDMTDLPLGYFPWTWRTRLYSKAIFNKALLAQHPGSDYVATDEYLDNYLRAAQNLYRAKSSQPQFIEGPVLAFEPYDKAARLR